MRDTHVEIRAVSILVLMEVKREHIAHPRASPRRDVSILVLMEVKRECEICSGKKSVDVCFNPCFDGSEARGRNGSCFRNRGKRFQSLF